MISSDVTISKIRRKNTKHNQKLQLQLLFTVNSFFHFAFPLQICSNILQNRLSSEKLSLIFLVSKRCKDILWSIHSTLWIRNLIPFLFFVQFWKGTDRFQNSDQSPLLMISDLHSIYLFIESRDGIMMGFEQKLDFPDRLWCQLQQGIYKSELHYGQPRRFFFYSLPCSMLWC